MGIWAKPKVINRIIWNWQPTEVKTCNMASNQFFLGALLGSFLDKQ